MTPTERERIDFAQLKLKVGQILMSKFLEYNDGKFHTGLEMNPPTHALTEFITKQIKQEGDKARNQAIQDCIDIVSRTQFYLGYNPTEALEQLKTKP